MARIRGPEYTSQAWRNRNRSMPKMTRDRLSSAVDAYDRILAVSTEIRSRHGLAPVAEGQSISGARARLAKMSVRKGRKAPSLDQSLGLTPLERLAAVAKDRAALDRERERIDAEIKSLVGQVPATRIAAALGISRQRVYQLA